MNDVVLSWSILNSQLVVSYTLTTLLNGDMVKMNNISETNLTNISYTLNGLTSNTTYTISIKLFSVAGSIPIYNETITTAPDSKCYWCVSVRCC